MDRLTPEGAKFGSFSISSRREGRYIFQIAPRLPAYIYRSGSIGLRLGNSEPQMVHRRHAAHLAYDEDRTMDGDHAGRGVELWASAEGAGATRRSGTKTEYIERKELQGIAFQVPNFCGRHSGASRRNIAGGMTF